MQKNVKPAVKANKKTPSWRHQETSEVDKRPRKAASKMGILQHRATSKMYKRKQIQHATNRAVNDNIKGNDNIKEIREKVNTAISRSKNEPLQQRQTQANSKICNDKKAKPANRNNEAKQIQQATKWAISKNKWEKENSSKGKISN